MTEAPRAESPAARRHWRRTLALTLALLSVWFLVTIITSFFPEWLNQREFLGFPVGFYFAAQGTLLIYLAIVGVHTWAMNRLDKRYKATNQEQ
ncbi:DUF4212 domain-containing protein [Niveibacterium sp. 24ML]|uniref:DUF4212 domain-containing protein n=1 Tax=Niveibacterium sp. 24ML TaxID=2985512 RepID=UPI00226EBE7C|nr:DUF4212 domain-containing protein [Niveibacterium sp. 24ML]MCX9157209.1 DUF4212 domain-containing protein [Niveibacterium sp. 24ML]